MQWAIHKQPGFTIVELLIVIVVIAILAAITVVAYNGVTSRANQVAARSDLSNFVKTMELYKADQGSYPTSLTSSIVGVNFNRPVYDTAGGNIYYCHRLDNDELAIGVASKGGESYVWSSRTGAVTTYAFRATASTTCSTINATWGTSNSPAIEGYTGSSNTWAGWTAL